MVNNSPLQLENIRGNARAFLLVYITFDKRGVDSLPPLTQGTHVGYHWVRHDLRMKAWGALFWISRFWIQKIWKNHKTINLLFSIYYAMQGCVRRKEVEVHK